MKRPRRTFFDEWYNENTQLDRSDALAGWNAAVSAAASVALYNFGEDDVGRAIDELTSK